MKEVKILELARKLKRLAEDGVGGEKENAAVQLQRILSKYKISLEDISEDKKESRSFKFKNGQLKFLFQIVAAVVPDWDLRYRRITTGRKKCNEIEIDLSLNHWVEVEEKFEFYWNKLQEEQGILYDAFIQKNKLYLHTENPEQGKRLGEEDEMSNEEKEKLRRILLMMETMQQHTNHKQLTSPNP